MLLNSLGRVLVASGLVAVTSFMASTAVFAANPTKYTDTTISGTVASTLSLEVKNPKSLTDTLTANVLHDFHVADVEYSTNGNGLNIRVDSPDGSLRLFSADAGVAGATIPFQIGIKGHGYKDNGEVLRNTGSSPVALTSEELWINSTNPITNVIPGTYIARFFLTATDN